MEHNWNKKGLITRSLLQICGHTHTLCIWFLIGQLHYRTDLTSSNFKIKITNNWNTNTKFPLNSTGSLIFTYGIMPRSDRWGATWKINCPSGSQLLWRTKSINMLEMQCSKKSLPGFSLSTSYFEIQKFLLLPVVIFQHLGLQTKDTHRKIDYYKY